MNVKKTAVIILILTLVFSLSACNDSDSEEENQGTILTITGYGDETTFSLSDIEQLGTDVYTFSGRNKENNNERQIRKYTGIELKAILEKSGYNSEDDTLLVTCSDGYSREYALKDLTNLYYFKDKTTEKGEVISPILAIMNEGDDIGNDNKYNQKDGSPLRLIFGQADYDSDYTKDFNMQGWASYVEKIEVKKGSGQ